MTHITFFKNSEKEITGFYSAGHAGYAESGSDIICSAISVLTINTINSIEAFTDDKFDVSVNEDEGIVIFKMAMPVSPETSILLKSYELGVSSVAEDNPKRVFGIGNYRSRQLLPAFFYQAFVLTVRNID